MTTTKMSVVDNAVVLRRQSRNHSHTPASHARQIGDKTGSNHQTARSVVLPVLLWQTIEFAIFCHNRDGQGRSRRANEPTTPIDNKQQSSTPRGSSTSSTGAQGRKNGCGERRRGHDTGQYRQRRCWHGRTLTTRGLEDCPFLSYYRNTIVTAMQQRSNRALRKEMQPRNNWLVCMVHAGNRGGKEGGYRKNRDPCYRSRYTPRKRKNFMLPSEEGGFTKMHRT